MARTFQLVDLCVRQYVQCPISGESHCIWEAPNNEEPFTLEDDGTNTVLRGMGTDLEHQQLYIKSGWWGTGVGGTDPHESIFKINLCKVTSMEYTCGSLRMIHMWASPHRLSD